MVRDEREHSGFEESDAAPSSSARTGRADDARREGEGLQGNHREAYALHGPVQGLACRRHRVCHLLGGLQHRGPEGALAGDDRAVQRHRCEDRRHGRHQLRRHRRHHRRDACALPCQRGLQLPAGMDDVERVAAHLLWASPRHCREDRPRSCRLLRAQLDRRHALTHH